MAREPDPSDTARRRLGALSASVHVASGTPSSWTPRRTGGADRDPHGPASPVRHAVRSGTAAAAHRAARELRTPTAPVRRVERTPPDAARPEGGVRVDGGARPEGGVLPDGEVRTDGEVRPTGGLRTNGDVRPAGGVRTDGGVRPAGGVRTDGGVWPAGGVRPTGGVRVDVGVRGVEDARDERPEDGAPGPGEVLLRWPELPLASTRTAAAAPEGGERAAVVRRRRETERLVTGGGTVAGAIGGTRSARLATHGSAPVDPASARSAFASPAVGDAGEADAHDAGADNADAHDADAHDAWADTEDVLRRVAPGRLARARDGYSRRHGSPLDHEVTTEPAARGWAVPTRVGLVAALAVALVAGVVVARAATVLVPDAAHAVELPDVAGPAAGPAAPAQGEDPPRATPDAASTTTPSPTAGQAAARVVVHVVGQVARPGVIELPEGSRVADALTAAGGASPSADLALLNLARVLVDGEQVAVAAVGDPAPAPVSGSAAGPPAAGGVPAGPLDLNSATAADLDALPGIGPVLAGRIVAWREEHGRFRAVDELADVEGIGPALMERLAPSVRV